ncbi:hypothetical protein [Aquisalimonas sp.]|uniref:hypothetical protein n=1 Tax=unclassified Aquisalimonas TaxID=2644645 RepID=UPI0025B91569|nr:hypothetical protein [Aquisalimonas sp.]
MVRAPRHEQSPWSDTAVRRARLWFTVWMLFWVPVILWSYGPGNFLWTCNLAQFLILLALWTNNRLLLSSQVGTVVLVGVFWTPDFLLGLFTGGDLANFTEYMFNPELPLLARATSLFHIGIPVLALWLVYRVGYDGRGLWLQSALTVAVLLATWLLTDPERNVNWLQEPLGLEQVWLSQPAFVVVMMILYPVLLFWPGHLLTRLVLSRAGPRRSRVTS